MLDDRIEAEKGVLAIDDVDLEQRHAAVDADLGRGPSDEPETCQFLDSVRNCLRIAKHDSVCAFADCWIVRQVICATWKAHRDGHVGEQYTNCDRLRSESAIADLVERFLDRAMQRFA